MGSGSAVARPSGRVSYSSEVQKKVLIIDDDPLVGIGLKKFINKQGFIAETASSGEKARKKIELQKPFLVLLDVKLPQAIDGFAVLEFIRKKHPEITVIMISGQSETRDAVDAIKAGAHDYLEKPIDFERLQAILHDAGKTGCSAPRRGVSALHDFVYASERMQKVVGVMQRLALKSDITVLVLGETGTGKNFLCRKVHELSPRNGFPYVQIGCANIPEHLFESELFGYEKGAFTDAKNSKKGLIEAACGGTMLLDELGEIPYHFQAKLLGLLEEKSFRKVGGLHDTEADVRILAATNRNLYEQVQRKKFRLDLFYRLEVATIELPPLRERKEDIPLLAENFMRYFGEKYDCQPRIISQDGVRLLQEYSWPGNVRQLKNLIERLVVLSDREKIGTDEISSTLLMQQQRDEQLTGKAIDLDTFSGLSLKAMEERHIRTALKLAGGNQRKAAKLLNITRDTLRYRLKKMNVQ